MGWFVWIDIFDVVFTICYFLHFIFGSVTFRHYKQYEFENTQVINSPLATKCDDVFWTVKLHVLNLHVLQSVVRKVRWAEEA
jgi:hypothetical protein